MRARIIGLGQTVAGDDGVGLAVIEWLRQHRTPDGVEIMTATDGSAVVALLETPVPVVIIDAILGSPVGQVIELTLEQLGAARQPRPVSTHAMGVAAAIELARVLTPHTISPSIRLVAVTIARPRRYQQKLSRAVGAAVPRAAQRALNLIGA